jgi:adenylosuccinate synthase
VVKAYTTRVGEGPFPTEQENGIGKQLRTAGDEFGRTTGRARRCGWFDAVVSRYARMVNGITKLAITKLDVLDQMPRLKIAVAYRVGKKIYRTMPPDLEVLKRCVPIYRNYAGWMRSTTRVRRFDDLPRAAQIYLQAISRLTGAPIGIISVGPKRDDTIFVKNKHGRSR